MPIAGRPQTRQARYAKSAKPAHGSNPVQIAGRPGMAGSVCEIRIASRGSNLGPIASRPLDRAGSLCEIRIASLWVQPRADSMSPCRQGRLPVLLPVCEICITNLGSPKSQAGYVKCNDAPSQTGELYYCTLLHCRKELTGTVLTGTTRALREKWISLCDIEIGHPRT